MGRYRVAGTDIAYSAPDDCFWVVGQNVRKVSRTGQVIATSAVHFAWTAVSVAVKQKDGSVIVGEGQHPQVAGSLARVLIFDSNAQLRTTIDHAASSVAVDEQRGVGWAAGFGNDGLAKFDLATGKILATAPIAGALAVEPDTGCLWVCGESEIDRIDPAGRWIWSKASLADSQKWAQVLPP